VSQPRYTPIAARDEVRPQKHLEPPRPWRAHRPAEHAAGPLAPSRTRIGAVGSDQGYALRLAEAIAGELVLGNGEHADDALAVIVQIALRRAARFGRAPVRTDLEVARTLLSYDTVVSDEAAKVRRATVVGAAHDTWRCREIADLVPAEAVSGSVAEAAEAALDWATISLP
jgi:hypothetical protein